MSDIASELFGARRPLACRYVDLLGTAGVERGLIGPREVDRLWERHIFNSLAVADLVEPGATVVDVGSGAGLPGIPLALARTDLSVTLVEPLLRRATFLTEVVAELALTGQVRVARTRAEEHAGRYDSVVSRALAPLPRLVEWCEPLRSPTGTILALKGRSAVQELEAAAALIRSYRLTGEVLTVRAHPATQPTSVVRLRAR